MIGREDPFEDIVVTFPLPHPSLEFALYGLTDADLFSSGYHPVLTLAVDIPVSFVGKEGDLRDTQQKRCMPTRAINLLDGP